LRHVVTTLLFLSLLAPLASIADEPGSVIMAKAGESPLFIWDATPVVAIEVKQKQDTQTSLAHLEAAAARILIAKMQGMKSLQQASVRVVYQKIGAVNPQYGQATMAGIENLVTVHATRAAAEHAATTVTSLPADFTATVDGKLPPQQ
jgi:hypothetical protein